MRKSIGVFGAVLAVMIGGCGCGANTEKGQEDSMEKEGYILVWNDEFDGDTLDLTKWSYQIGDGLFYGLNNWGNAEQQYYTDREENVSVADGVLKITAQKEENRYEKYSFTSGRIRTVTDENEVLFATTYGRVEARIQMIGGNGIWPAFWMLPVDNSVYGKWAASGELDIMEEKGRLPGQIGGTAHFGEQWPNNTYRTKDYFFPEGTDASDFHVYAIEWDPDAIRWYVDDECYSTLENWYAKSPYGTANYTAPAPFDVPFYIVLNLAVGGTFDPEAVVTSKSFPAEMNVDYVRVYHRMEGYQEKEEAQRSKPDGIADYDCIKEPLPNKNRVYNGTFDEGTNQLAYWHKNDGVLEQKGILFEDDHTYGIRFDLSSEKECEINVSVVTTDGTVLLDETVAVKAEQGYIYAYTFEGKEAQATLSFELPEDVVIDNVIIMQID